MRRESGPLGTVLFDGPNDEYRLRLDIPIRDLECRMGMSVAMIGVNPSTANAHEPDQTIRKDIGFACVHKWGEICKLNLFGYRAKDVRELRLARDPIGERNDEVIFAALQAVDAVIGCWGPRAKLPPHLRERWRDIARMAQEAGKNILCFGLAQDGMPLHTLMLSYSRHLQIWKPPL